MYCAAFELSVLGKFHDHQGFDGVMLGRAGVGYHFEFTYCRDHPIVPTPTAEDLLVFYLPDPTEWALACARAEASGLCRVPSLNPYWEVSGRTFEDGDGYRTVLQNTSAR